MANEEQLSILKKSVIDWNKWRIANPKLKIDLNFADLRGLDLSKANLYEAHLVGARLVEACLKRADLTSSDLIRADLSKVDLGKATLSRAYLNRANLHRTNLSGSHLNEANLTLADLSMATLNGADLRGANLSQANLNGVNLNRANLGEANLSEANLNEANLGEANLNRANLSNSQMNETNLVGSEASSTIFSNLDLRKAFGLEKVKHFSPSSVGIETLQLSHGEIPEIFLRGCGLSDWEIEQAKLYNPNLTNEEIIQKQYTVYELRATRAIQISPLFISYSQKDSIFVDRLEIGLNTIGVRFWRDIHDLKAGRIEKQIDRAIRQNPTVILVLSDNSLRSDWVEHEVRTARQLEEDFRRDVLCPVTLDSSWKNSRWPKRIMEQIKEYNILDFSSWEDDFKFKGMFRKLIDGLELFYKDKSHGE